jgi:hypothetical protein
MVAHEKTVVDDHHCVHNDVLGSRSIDWELIDPNLADSGFGRWL